MTLRGRLFFGVLLAVLIAAPYLFDRYILSILLLVLLATYFGQAWNIMLGFCGLLSLGNALYLGLGAYVSAILFVNYGIGPWLGVFAAMAVAMVAAAIIGWLGFRFRIEGVYFSLLTIAFAEVARIGFDNFSWAGGAAGFFLPVQAEDAAQWWNLRAGPVFFYYLALILALGSLLLAAVLRASKLGYSWLAIREDTQAASALGVDVTKARYKALFISSAMTAVGGVYIAFWTNNLFPTPLFDTGRSIDICIAPIVGGVGTLFGPLIGALLLIPLGEGLIEILRTLGFNAPGIKALVYGLLLMIIITVTPSGVWPWISRKLGLGERPR